MIVKSPIEHPEVEEFLGEKNRPCAVVHLGGCIDRWLLAFLLIAASQGNFFAQLKGGKADCAVPGPGFCIDL